ncbi:MAG: hypothetical protein QGI05_03035 [Candidatus Omnitrophota bacterium]|jgi:hypothetical protein|nr:hypothetical protein [Candidatus Omnitrophota bacterium]
MYTIDGDWDEYFNKKLPDIDRLPKQVIMRDLISREIDVAERVLNGRFIHFIHTSRRAKDFFLIEPFLGFWRKISEKGGDVGLHCHEDDPYVEYRYHDVSNMRKVIFERTKAFREKGLEVKCYRSGFLGFSSGMVRILESNRIYFDFSCEPERFLKHGDTVICDWRGAPSTHYRLDYNKYCKEGNSKVWEIPLGFAEGKYLYFEKFSKNALKKVALSLKKRSVDDKMDIVVSVLAHSYDYASLKVVKEIEEKLSLLKNYGKFINIKELDEVTSTRILDRE